MHTTVVSFQDWDPGGSSFFNTLEMSDKGKKIKGMWLGIKKKYNFAPQISKILWQRKSIKQRKGL
jgi:hypothetical protein